MTTTSALAGVAFQPFQKIPRLRRDVVITEKIDGTNACVRIDAAGHVLAGSRARWITPESDNYGFARWVREHETELRALGEGTHFGEWWGAGIQRRYGLDRKRFSLFNTSRWHVAPTPLDALACAECPCVSVVPVLGYGPMDRGVDEAMARLREHGSIAAPGFKNPEGIVVYHVASGSLFKVTLDRDESPKSVAA